jgi:protease IV
MARRRDVVIGVIIGLAALVFLGMFAFMIIGVWSTSGEDFEMSGFSSGNIGVIELDGEITDVMSRQIVKQLDRWSQTSTIKAVILQINSPGGGVAASQEIYDAVLRFKGEDKPVVADMSSVAASGGYYVACAADRIVANPGTVTGSIGVIFQFHTFKNLMDKVGVGTETIKSGEMKDVGTYARPMTDKEHQMLQAVVMDTYDQFVGVVAKGRGMEAEEVRKIADGSVFTGRQALGLGLVDTLGGFHEAVQIAADMAKLKGEPSLVRPYKREKVGIFDLFGKFMGRFEGTATGPFSGPQLLYLFQ